MSCNCTGIASSSPSCCPCSISISFRYMPVFGDLDYLHQHSNHACISGMCWSVNHGLGMYMCQLAGRQHDQLDAVPHACAGERMGFWVVAPVQYSVWVGLCVTYMVTAGQSLQVYTPAAHNIWWCPRSQASPVSDSAVPWCNHTVCCLPSDTTLLAMLERLGSSW